MILEGKSDATRGSDGLGAGASAHVRLDGAALGLNTRGRNHTGAVYPFPEDDCYGIDLCL